MYATDRQMSDAHHRLMPPTLGAGYNNQSKRRDLELGVSVHKLFGELDEIAADLGNVGRQQ